MSRRIFLVIVGLVTAVWAAAATTRTPLRRLLVVTHSAGYEHDVIRRVAPDRPAQVEQVLTDLGRESGAFAVTFRHSSEDLGALTADVLRQFHAVLFFTTGSLPLSLTRAARCSSTYGMGRDSSASTARATRGTTSQRTGSCWAVSSTAIPGTSVFAIVVEDSSHPATTHLGTAFWITDEIYQFRHWSRQGVHVLLRLDADFDRRAPREAKRPGLRPCLDAPPRSGARLLHRARPRTRRLGGRPLQTPPSGWHPVGAGVAVRSARSSCID